jgi:hypothetical protein
MQTKAANESSSDEFLLVILTAALIGSALVLALG